MDLPDRLPPLRQPESAPEEQQQPAVAVAEEVAEAPAAPREVVAPTASSLLPQHRALDAVPASWGWRGRVRRLSGGLVSPGPAEKELRHRHAAVAVRRTWTRPMTVMVANPKGGACKTPTVWMLGATFGMARGGSVVAWDNNETRGTLGVRGQIPDRVLTVHDLLGDLERFERVNARAGDLATYLRSQGAAQFDILASDEDAANMAQIGQPEYERLRTVLARYYRLTIVDTGNNVRSANWQAAADSADLLVVASSYKRDDAFAASWMLDHLEATGRGELARGAVTVLSAKSTSTHPQMRRELVEHFTARTSAVVEIPYDPAIAPGDRLDIEDIHQTTREAWLMAAAAIADCLTAADHPAQHHRKDTTR